MPYKYETTRRDYSDLASGRVFYSLAGHPAFPVRLASEIFQRCIEFRKTLYHISTPCTLYDPCCGAAYHLSVLGYLYGEQILEILASDVDERAVALAKRNLELLTIHGLDQRVAEITTMIQQYGKDSHRDALRSAQRLRSKISTCDLEHPIATRVFQANATDQKIILANIQPKSVDLVFSDVPYGQHSQWHDTESTSNPLISMLDALLGVLSLSSIVAIAFDKGQKVSHDQYQRVEQFQIGKRRVVILRPR